MVRNGEVEERGALRVVERFDESDGGAWRRWRERERAHCVNEVALIERAGNLHGCGHAGLDESGSLEVG
jgi:hypothetical protein